MVFREKTQEQRYRQIAKLFLRRWRFYEKHSISLMATYHNTSVVKFFNSLKQLDQEEVVLLSERYYKSVDYCKYNAEIGDFESAKPITLAELSCRLGMEESELVTKYMVIEIKFGEYLARKKKLAKEK